MTTPTAPEAATSIVDKLTDEGIKKRLTLIARLHKTQMGYRDAAQREMETLMKEKEMLIGVQITRLRAQLSTESTAKAEAEQ